MNPGSSERTWKLYGLRSEASAIVEQLPQAARRLRQTLENDRPTTAKAIEQVQKAATELQRAADVAAPPPPSTGVQRVQVEAAPFSIGEYLMYGSLGAAAAAGQLVLILFLVYFLLASGDLYRRKLVKLAGPSLTEKKIPLQILTDIDRQISASDRDPERVALRAPPDLHTQRDPRDIQNVARPFQGRG